MGPFFVFGCFIVDRTACGENGLTCEVVGTATGSTDTNNCDFCLHTRLAKGETPACVASCKYDALVFGDINDPYSYISRLLKVKDTVRIRPELGTEPSLRYIPVVKKGV